MKDEPTTWRTLAALLPPEQSEEVMDCWSIGEQEAALNLIISTLLGHDIPITEGVRAQLAVTSEAWGEREAHEDRIARCRASTEDDSAVRLLPTDTPPFPGTSLTDQPPLAGLTVVPWITCVRCGRTLARAHRQEPWGHLSFLPVHYVLLHPENLRQTRILSPETGPQEALTLLTSGTAPDRAGPRLRQTIVTTSRLPFLRTAHVDDLDEITGLHTQARTAYYRAGGLPDTDPELLTHPEALAGRRAMWRRALEDPTRTVLCATQADNVVGILALGPPLDADISPTTTAQLNQIHVRPGHWGQGIGTHLHTAFVDILREASLRAGVLEHWARNTRAHSFYTHHGWHPDGHHRPGPANTNYVRLRLTVG